MSPPSGGSHIAMAGHRRAYLWVPVCVTVKRILLLTLLLPLAAAHTDHEEPSVPEHPLFDSGDLAAGDSWSYTFDQEGAFTYLCRPHQWMVGTVTVLAADGAPTMHRVAIVEDPDPWQWGYTPTNLTVRVGDTVTWTNDGTMIHTVTSAEEAAPDEDAPGLGLGLLVVGLAAMALRRR